MMRSLAETIIEMRKCRSGKFPGLSKTDQSPLAPSWDDHRRAPRRLSASAGGPGIWKIEVARIEERELEGHRADIIADVRRLVEKYRKIFDWDVPDIDQAAADRLILSEVRKALGDLENELLS
jgi:hypothetical protein